MKVYIKVWPNKTATILTGNGEVVWTFSSLSEAWQACNDWCSIIHVGNSNCCDDPDEAAAYYLA